MPRAAGARCSGALSETDCVSHITNEVQAIECGRAGKTWPRQDAIHSCWPASKQARLGSGSASSCVEPNCLIAEAFLDENRMPTCALFSHFAAGQRQPTTVGNPRARSALASLRALLHRLAFVAAGEAFLDFLRAIPRSNDDFSLF